MGFELCLEPFNVLTTRPLQNRIAWALFFAPAHHFYGTALDWIDHVSTYHVFCIGPNKD